MARFVAIDHSSSTPKSKATVIFHSLQNIVFLTKNVLTIFEILFQDLQKKSDNSLGSLLFI
jgi:hypothetical protein